MMKKDGIGVKTRDYEMRVKENGGRVLKDCRPKYSLTTRLRRDYGVGAIHSWTHDQV